MGHRALRVTRIAVIGGLFALLSTGITPSVAKAQTSIYIVQGLPSRTVSVTVDGDEVVGGLIALSDKKGSNHPSRVDTGTGGQAAELAARSGR
jgi:hypothetical protein